MNERLALLEAKNFEDGPENDSENQTFEDIISWHNKRRQFQNF